MTIRQQRTLWLQQRWGGRYRVTAIIQHAVPVELYVGLGATVRDYAKSSAGYWSIRRGCLPRCSHNVVLN